jgi:methionyl-tRNA formyltransferase
MPLPTDLRILFLGTPEFAAISLQKLISEGARVVVVVTAPDKPAGRGLHLRKSAVKEVAEAAGIPVLQPEKLKDLDFLQKLKSFEPDLGIVVAFRMLPEQVWRMPPMGTFNLHASLLPGYRGAAPIHWAIMRGETETGITTFFLRHEIDTGDLLLQEKVAIGSEETVGELYDRLQQKGADLVWKTVKGIAAGNLKPFPQDERKISLAPKIHRETCRLDPSSGMLELHNQVRGLSPQPGAFLESEGAVYKIYKTRPEKDLHEIHTLPGKLFIIRPGVLALSCKDGWLQILEIQPEGKRRMDAKAFLAGHPVPVL